MKKEFTYKEYCSDNIENLDRQILLQDIMSVPNKNTAIHVNNFGVEYHKIPIKDAIKLIYREDNKIFICFKQISNAKRGAQFKGDSAGYVKENAEFMIEDYQTKKIPHNS